MRSEPEATLCRDSRREVRQGQLLAADINTALAFVRNPGHLEPGRCVTSLAFQNNNNAKDNKLLVGHVPVVLPCLWYLALAALGLCQSLGTT